MGSTPEVTLRDDDVASYSAFTTASGDCAARLHLATDNPITPGVATTLILAAGVVSGIESACQGTPPPPSESPATEEEERPHVR